MSSVFIVLPSLICLKTMFKVVNATPVKLLKTSPVIGLKSKKNEGKKDELKKVNK